MLPAMPPKKAATSARLSPFCRGIIYGMHLMDATLEHTASTMLKTDGTHPTQQCVSQPGGRQGHSDVCEEKDCEGEGVGRREAVP